MVDFRAHNSLWRLALLFLVAVGFVILGMILSGVFGEIPSFVEEPRRRLPEQVVTAIGWVCILYFGLVGIVFGKRFFDNRPHLYIGSDGIISSTWSGQVIPWNQITNVTELSYSGQKSIILHLKNPEQFPGRGLPAILDRINLKFVRGDIIISVNGTNRTHKEAMQTIAHFRSDRLDNP